MALISWLATASASCTPGSAAEPADSIGRGSGDKLYRHRAGDGGRPGYGEYLAGECVTCHQQSGHADGIPSIVGLPRDYFIRALFEYKTNVRSNEVMKLRVTNLVNDEIAALAAYFSQARTSIDPAETMHCLAELLEEELPMTQMNQTPFRPSFGGWLRRHSPCPHICARRANRAWS